MPKFVAVSRERHAEKSWRRFQSYAFAAQTRIAALVAAEIPKAALALPLGFVQQEQGYLPIALLDLHTGQNVYVNAEGRWLAGYIPSVFRGYPFQLLRTEDQQWVLCIDEDSGLLVDDPSEQPFFTDAGEPAETVRQVLDFLQQIEQNRQATQQICSVLQRHDLIQPWPITLKEAEQERKVEGVFRVDEDRLKGLGGEILAELNAVGALPLAYCQLLSMQHLPTLGKLVELKTQAQVALQGQELWGDHDDGVLQVDWDQLPKR